MKINNKKRASEYDEDFLGRSNQELVANILKNGHKDLQPHEYI